MATASGEHLLEPSLPFVLSSASVPCPLLGSPQGPAPPQYAARRSLCSSLRDSCGSESSSAARSIDRVACCVVRVSVGGGIHLTDREVSVGGLGFETVLGTSRGILGVFLLIMPVALALSGTHLVD